MAEKDKWFKRKRFGWGWTPSNWKGWTVLLAYVLYVILISRSYQEQISRSQLIEYLSLTFIPLIFLIAFSFWKGETPRWQWNKKNISKKTSEKKIDKTADKKTKNKK